MRATLCLTTLLTLALASPCPFLAARDEAERKEARRALAQFGDHTAAQRRQLPDVVTVVVPAVTGGASQVVPGLASAVPHVVTTGTLPTNIPVTQVVPTAASTGNPNIASAVPSVLPDPVASIVAPVPSLVQGLTGAVAQNVNPSDLRPDADHPFQAPGPTDQRGPCPGLNAMANHGYLPRNGIVTASQVIEQTANVFNFAPDLSGLLATIAILFSGNLETETWSIGGEDDRTYSPSGIGSKAAGRQFGLDAHSRCEGDISPTREDFFLANGDNHSGSPRKFARFTELAKTNGNGYNLAAVNALYGENAQESIANNPRLFFQSYTVLVILGAYPFIPEFMSNGTYGAGGVSNYESIGSIMGYNATDNGFCYVPERLPENWYRRSTPYGVADGLIPGLLPTYAAGPVLPNPVSILQNPAEVTNIGCALYQGITSGIPAGLAGSTNDRISAAVTYAQAKLLAGFPSLYGCTTSASLNDTAPADSTAESLQETGPGGGQKYGVCAAS